MKAYQVTKSNGKTIGYFKANSITKVANQFMETLEKPAKSTLCNREKCLITFNDNHTIMSDFVISQK